MIGRAIDSSAMVEVGLGASSFATAGKTKAIQTAKLDNPVHLQNRFIAAP
jgi:hypothetical protein